MGRTVGGLELREWIVSTPTLARVGAELIASKEKGGARDGYVRKLVQHLRDYVLPFYGADRAVDTMTDAAEHERFKTNLDGEIDSPRTINRVLVTLRQTMKFARKKGLLPLMPELPGNYPERVAEAVERWQILSPQEIGTVIARVKARYRPFLIFLANTGIRLNEGLSLGRKQCDLDRAVIHIRATNSKSRKWRTIDLNDAAIRALRIGLAAGGDRPFAFDRHRIWEAWHEARCASGAEGVRIHDLRHSRISNLLDAGVPVHVVRDIAGHCSIAVTDLYAHTSDDARRAAAKHAPVDVDPVAPAATRGTIRGTIRCSGTESNRRHGDFQSPLRNPESPDRSSGCGS